jgi:hypothetical protein
MTDSHTDPLGLPGLAGRSSWNRLRLCRLLILL